MTDRERELINAYIPHKRDKSLLQGVEYYLLDDNERVRKVWYNELSYDRCGHLIVRPRNNKGVVTTCSSDDFGYLDFSYLYDNKQDCIDRTHFAYSDWETLRELEEQELSK